MADDKYFLPLFVAINSILENASLTDRISLNIIDVGLTETNKNHLLSLGNSDRSTLCLLNLDDNIKTILTKYYQESSTNKKKYITKAALAKFFIPLLSKKLDKTIYLDCDIIVLDSLMPLWKIDIDQRFAAVVPDMKLTHSHRNMNISFSLKDMYFNSGVMVLNLIEMRKHKCLDDYLTIHSLNKNTGKLTRFVDQDIFNLIFKDNVRILPLRYNLFSRVPVIGGDIGFNVYVIKWISYRGCISKYYDINALREAIKNPAIVHFVTRRKPWTSLDGFMFDRWISSARKLKYSFDLQQKPFTSYKGKWIFRLIFLLLDTILLCFGDIPSQLKAKYKAILQNK